MGITEKIKQLEDELVRTQVNKSTEHHIGILRAKIAKLKRSQEIKSKKSTKSHGFDIKRNGDATVVLIGFPSVGKSTLLNKLTSANSTTGSYQFTTMTVIPGIMEYLGAKIQVLDLPGIIKGASTGKGFGKQVISVARNADLVLIILDIFQPLHRYVLNNELRNMGIRLDQKPPNVILEKTNAGGISVWHQIQLKKISTKLLKDILHIYNINNARIIIKEDINTDQLIDYIIGNRTYTKSLTIINKIDLVNKEFRNELEPKINSDYIEISAGTGYNINLLKKKIYEKLNLIRIYLKPKNEKMNHRPLHIKKSSTVSDICNKLHKNMKKNFRYGIVYGKSVKFNGQKVGLGHILEDGDIITIIKTKNY